MRVGVYKVAMASPSDVSGLIKLIDIKGGDHETAVCKPIRASYR
jgi:hypothetical protein